MPISSTNPIKFIDDALFCTSPFALSYADPDQKWLIRQHLISLFQNFPSLKPSVGVFTHDDGTEVKLVNVNGELPVSPPAPPVPLTIWLHEFYPHLAPIVYVNIENSMYPIYQNNPFVDSSSGATISSYLKNWQFPKCNLSDLVRNLTKLFSHNHPFFYSGTSSGCSHFSLLSKTEAMDRLACAIFYDTAAITAETEKEIENLAAIQVELTRRRENLEILMRGLEEERGRLKVRTKKLWDESDKLLNWLKVYEEGSVNFSIDDAFEALDGESENVRECLADDLGLEDLMYALDKAVEEGVLSFEDYMKKVRVLAREQFLLRAKMAKIERPKDLLWLFR